MTLMALSPNRDAASRTYRPGEAAAWMPCWLDLSAYATVNRHQGPRGRGRIAQLNALYADLDVYRVPWLARYDREVIADLLLSRIAAAGLPAPSFMIDSGRGFYSLWLIDPLPAAAEPRWRAAQTALVDLLAPIGADRACTDAARILRLPGTINGKIGAEVRIVSGDGARRDFDALADAVYAASGRPTRAALVQRKARKNAGAGGRASTPRGLPPAARFAQVLDDLDRIRVAWGGAIPVGMRNTWFHLAVTALTWTMSASDIHDRALEIAAIAIPDLPEREVEATIKAAVVRADRVTGGFSGPDDDTRLLYSGAEMAARLGVERPMAETLGLRQIIPDDLRRDRRNARRRAARASEGGQSRIDYLAANRRSAERPWVATGVSRTTWYRRQAAARKAEGSTVDDGTGAVPQQGGHGPAVRPAEIEDLRHGPQSHPQPTPTSQPAAPADDDSHGDDERGDCEIAHCSERSRLHEPRCGVTLTQTMQGDALRSGAAEGGVGAWLQAAAPAPTRRPPGRAP